VCAPCILSGFLFLDQRWEVCSSVSYCMPGLSNICWPSERRDRNKQRQLDLQNHILLCWWVTSIFFLSIFNASFLCLQSTLEVGLLRPSCELCTRESIPSSWNVSRNTSLINVRKSQSCFKPYHNFCIKVIFA
jgi:hypothetical protein